MNSRYIRVDHLARMGRFVAPGEGQCTKWLGAKSQGYAMFSYKGKSCHASRVLWEVLYGPIPEGLLVMHTCDNPECVNPSHLKLGTHMDNAQDMADKNRDHGRYTRARKLQRLRKILGK